MGEKSLERMEDPAAPAAYAENPSPLPDDERDWLRQVNGLIWREMPPDRFGHRRSVEADGTWLSREELDRLFRLIREHGLITSMGSGVFGFGYSIGVYEPGPAIPGFKEPPGFLICVTEHHLPPPDDGDVWPAGSHGEQMELAWRLFSQFTHSPKNAGMLEWHGMRPQRKRSDYDY